MHERAIAVPEYMAQFKARKWMSRWHSKRALDGGKRTLSVLDSDVADSLPRLWVMMQPLARRDDSNRLVCRPDASMGWDGVLCCGEFGIRLFVVTLLCWGTSVPVDSDGAERSMWTRVAGDVADVLGIVAEQAGATTRRGKTREAAKRQKYVVLWAWRRNSSR